MSLAGRRRAAECQRLPPGRTAPRKSKPRSTTTVAARFNCTPAG